MDSLFSEDPQYRRVQYKKLSDNPREWQQEIAGLVAERLPKDLSLSVDVVFQKVDDEKGYGLGTAIVQDPATGQQVGVPIIIRGWHLAPIDLYFRGGKIFPLNEENLAKTFYQGSLGVGMAPKQRPPDMSEDVFADIRNPPQTSKYATPMFDAIAGTLERDHIEAVKTAALADPTVLARYHVNGTLGVLRKYADSRPAATQQDRINRERTMALFTIKKDGPDAYRLFSAPDEVYDPIVLTTDRRGLRHFLDERRAELWDFELDPMTGIDQYGHFTIEPPKSPHGAPWTGPGPKGNGVDTSGNYVGELGEHKTPWVFDPRQDDRPIQAVTTAGRYAVKDADGVLAKGWVIPNVVDFSGSARPIKLFLGKALAAMQNRIAGIPLPDDGDAELKADRADAGKIGTLVYRDGDRLLATVPFQVTAVTVYKGVRALSVIDYQGNAANLILSPTTDGIIKVQGKESATLGPLLGPKANHIVSAKMFFVRMPRLCPVSSSAEDFKSLAAPHLDQAPLKIAMANGRYVFRGRRLAKYASASDARPLVGEKVAFDFNGLRHHEAEFLLRYWGLDREKTAHVLGQAGRVLGLEIHHLRLPDLPGPIKVASPARARFIGLLRPSVAELVKVAANLEDSQTVDAVLSLGFVNEENIGKFIASEAMLWEVTNILAKLLLAARIGVDDIPEENVQAALQHISRILEGLNRLKMLKENQEKTGAADPKKLVGGRLLTGTTPIGVAR